MKEFEIRRSIENYYDIQKIRVETFNRIVCWVKENRDRLIKVLSQSISETHVLGASHNHNEKNASHYGNVAHQKGASHDNNVNHIEDASQLLSETQYVSASQINIETQPKNVSHGRIETQLRYASHNICEAHTKDASNDKYETDYVNALKLLKKKKYSEFVKKFVLSHLKNEAQTDIGSQSEDEIQNRFTKILKDIEDLVWFHNKLLETEKELYRRIDLWSRDHPLRKEFLGKVKGIGPILASGLIAWLSNPILKADYVSQIWSYCGLAPGQERKKGKKVNYNPRLKTFCWKIGQSFIKFKCFGRELYKKFREQIERREPKWSKLHHHNYARRKVVKLFIASLWQKWRELNNLPVSKPYPISVLGHKDLITPEKWLEK